MRHLIYTGRKTWKIVEIYKGKGAIGSDDAVTAIQCETTYRGGMRSQSVKRLNIIGIFPRHSIMRLQSKLTKP